MTSGKGNGCSLNQPEDEYHKGKKIKEQGNAANTFKIAPHNPHPSNKELIMEISPVYEQTLRTSEIQALQSDPFLLVTS